MSDNIRELTSANFTDVVASGVTLVDFWTTWCPPCRRQGPIVEKLADAYAGRAVVSKLDTDANGDIAAKLGIENIPTLILFKDGGEMKRLIGLTEADVLSAELDKLLT
ncbi:MAG: redoxin family protein [Planctomycetota bacterium]|jgi:thioredoxin 1|nr:redoxin family protein [Planctomycetota bacterium]